MTAAPGEEAVETKKLAAEVEAVEAAEAVGPEDRGRPAGLHPAGELLKVGISSDEFGRVVWT